MVMAPLIIGPRFQVSNMQFNSTMLHVYLVGGTQDTNHDPKLFLQKVEQAMQAGITAFQYREKGSSTLTKTDRLKMALKLRQLCDRYHIPLLIDDDLELAFQSHADGIHVGQKDQRIQDVLHKTKGQLIVGYSCNTPTEIVQANQLTNVDYIGTGPVFPTQSKADADPAIGLDQLQKLNRLSSHPLVAIGGINQDNMAITLQTGVTGLSVISLILDDKSPQRAVQRMRSLYQ